MSDAVARLSAADVMLGGRRVLGPLDWKVGKGEHWAVLGSNGAGKTTLVSLIAARRHPHHGSVEILGQRLGRVDVRDLRRHIGVVSHAVADQLRADELALDVVMTGKTAALVPWWDRFGPDDRARASELLGRFRCGHLAHQPFGACSQGERQRVLLARSLFAEHPLLILDEPLAGVDLPGREALVSSLSAMADSATAPTTVLVSHSLEDLPPTTTHALLLRAGTAVAAGPAEEVLASSTLTECFGIPMSVRRQHGRWHAWADPSW